MKKYKISKEKVKQALITEPLRDGAFHHGKDDLDDKKCSVCAVGAVLRNTKGLEFSYEHGPTVTEGMSGSFSLNVAHESDNFMAKLSCEFEDASYSEQESPNSDDMRMFLLFLTEAFCPAVLEFEA